MLHGALWGFRGHAYPRASSVFGLGTAALRRDLRHASAGAVLPLCGNSPCLWAPCYSRPQALRAVFFMEIPAKKRLCANTKLTLLNKGMQGFWGKTNKHRLTEAQPFAGSAQAANGIPPLFSAAWAATPAFGGCFGFFALFRGFPRSFFGKKAYCPTGGAWGTIKMFFSCPQSPFTPAPAAAGASAGRGVAHGAAGVIKNGGGALYGPPGAPPCGRALQKTEEA